MSTGSGAIGAEQSCVRASVPHMYMVSCNVNAVAETAPHQGIQDHPRSHYKRCWHLLEMAGIRSSSQFDSVGLHFPQADCGLTAGSCYHSGYADEPDWLLVHG